MAVEGPRRRRVGSKKARLLRKDLELTEASAFAIRNVWKGLNRTRDALKSYQSDVGFYKAGLVDSHLAAHEQRTVLPRTLVHFCCAERRRARTSSNTSCAASRRPRIPFTRAPAGPHLRTQHRP